MVYLHSQDFQDISMALPSTMNAVVFDGPYKVSLQQRPVPRSKEICTASR